MPTVEDTGLPTENDIKEALAVGNFLLIIAGDQIDPRALRLGTAILAGHLTREWDLAMVDMNLFVDNNFASTEASHDPRVKGSIGSRDQAGGPCNRAR